MTRSQTPRRAGPPAGPDNYLTHTRGFRSWAFTLDHKRIGVMYLVGVLTALLLGGVFALIIRTELATPGPTIMGFPPAAPQTPADKQPVPPDAPAEATAQGKNLYNHLFTLHGTVMIFLVIIPSVPVTLGNFVLPLMLGAKDVAFPRLNLASF